MRYFLDSGILLRVVNRTDALHATVRASVASLKAAGHETVTAPQNIAEFWNVCTRPTMARGGLGLTVAECHRRLRVVERIVKVLPEPSDAYARWRALVVSMGVMGVQVHDARLVAFMAAHSINHLLTLNAADFRRYPALTAVSPAELLSRQTPGL